MGRIWGLKMGIEQKFISKMKTGLCVLGFALAMLCWGGLPANAASGDRLEVTQQVLVLHAGPSTSYGQRLTLNAGEQLVELDRSGAWVLVSVLSNQVQGWVHKSGVAPSTAKAGAKKSSSSKQKAAAQSKPKSSKQAKAAEPVRKKEAAPKVAAPEPEIFDPEKAATVRRTQLGDLGYTKGVMFEGATVAHARTIFFEAPMDSRITNGTFRLIYRTAPNLHELANASISVNDIPYRQFNLSADSDRHVVDVDLPPSAFRGGLVKVTIRAALPVSDDRCFDERLSNVFMHIEPSSWLEIRYQPVNSTIRDAWRMLPQDVTVSLPEGALSKGQFASTLSLMAMLVDGGKRVHLTRLPEIGDIVVASKQSIQSLVADKRLKMDNGESMPDDGGAVHEISNLSLMHLPNRTAIVITDPYDVQPIYLLNESWRDIAAGEHYRVFRPDSSFMYTQVGTEDDAGYFSLPLNKLGMGTEARFLTREVTWQTVINPFELPLGTQPDFLKLNIVAPVRWEKDPTYELYVFLNDVLVKTARLENTGLLQQFTINLPNEYQKQFNDVRIVVQHDIDSDDCHGVMPHDFVQVLPDSALVVKRVEDEAPRKFAELSRYFLHGFDTYVDQGYLDHPEVALHMMARLAADFPLLIDHSRLQFVDTGTALEPANPFVAIGRFKLGDSVEAPVRFDQGHVRILTPKGETYFDVDNLDKISVAEIAKSGNAYGLWVAPSLTKFDDRQPPMERLRLAEDDVAFIDANGVVKTLDSQEPSLAQVYYPDVEDWFDVLGKYRFWLMVLLWFLLTMVVVYLYRMSRANKLAREQDDALYQAEEERMQGSDNLYGENEDAFADESLDHLDEQR